MRDGEKLGVPSSLAVRLAESVWRLRFLASLVKVTVNENAIVY